MARSSTPSRWTSSRVRSSRSRRATAHSYRSRSRSARPSGASYPLGAIIPSPVGLSRKGSYWSKFPYADLAGIYDVFLPMGYYTYHGNGAKLAYSDTVGNVRILRSKKGCSTIPIHLIGGEAEKSSAAEVRGVRARYAGGRVHRRKPLRMDGNQGRSVAGAHGCGRTVGAPGHSVPRQLLARLPLRPSGRCLTEVSSRTPGATLRKSGTFASART